MLDSSMLIAFVPAVVAIVLAPGPDTIYALSTSLTSGRTAGFAAAAGTTTGIAVHTTAAVLGLSALLRTSALAYTVVKYLGAAYLVVLGLQAFRRDDGFSIRADSPRERLSIRQAYARAVAINVSNPKVAVFVLAFFPQFVPPSANAPVQMALLGLIYAVLGLVYLSGVALFAGRVRHLVVESTTVGRLVRYASGSVLVGFGLALAFEKRPSG